MTYIVCMCEHVFVYMCVVWFVCGGQEFRAVLGYLVSLKHLGIHKTGSGGHSESLANSQTL